MSTRTFLAILLVCIFLISLAFSFYYRISPTTDAKAYTRIARNLAGGFGYIEHIENAGRVSADDAIVRVGPGYEFFLAGIYWIAGGQNLPIVWIFQAFLRVLTAFFIYRLSVLLFQDSYIGTSIGLISAIIFGFMPDLIVVGGMLLAETLFLFLLVASVYYSVLLLRYEKLSQAYITGILWSAALLVRPTVIPMILFLTILLVQKRRIFFAVITVFFCIIFAGAWSARNSFVYGKPLFTTTAGSYALWIGNNAGATGGYDKTPQIQSLIDSSHSVDLSQKAFRDYFSFIVHRPAKFIELQFKKSVMYFSFIRPMGFWLYLNNKPVDKIITLALSGIYTIFLFILGTLGAYLYFNKNIKDKIYIFGMFLLQPLVVIPTYVETRYRSPFYIFLAIFAAYAIYYLLKNPFPKKVLLIIILVFIIISSIDIIYSLDIVLDRIKDFQE